MWEIIQSNKRKSFWLALFMAVLLSGIGAVFGVYFLGSSLFGLIAALLIWIVLSLIAYFQGRNIFLSIAGAKKIAKEDHPRLFNIVEEMKIASLLPAMPDIYIIDDPSPNAFAAGRNPETAAVAVTTGLLNTLNRDELQGVIAHEIGHIVNRDTLFMSMLGVMLGAVVMLAAIARRFLFYGGGARRSRSSSGGGQGQVLILAVGLLLIIIAPLLARVIYLAASRKREYLADASSAVYTRFPEGLAGALEKISASSIEMRNANEAVAPMYIINPLQKIDAGRSGQKSRDSLFSTHPSPGNRIRILRGMAGGSGYLAYERAFLAVTGSKKNLLPPSAIQGKAAQQPAVALPSSSSRGKEGKEFSEKVMIAGAMTAGAVIADAVKKSAGEPETHAGRVRETGDAVWKSRDYRFIQCECDAVLKVPPEYKRDDVICLRCRRRHPVV
ncbi:MAG TPA: M48 family metallopeptidase [Acidobacteriota bacterium]|nr:M48 family metallopeptidase [Acidobacteriota bacterium]